MKPMPSRTRKRRLSLSYPLALFGAAGLVVSGLGYLPGAPAWVWPGVMLVGVLLRPLTIVAVAAMRRIDEARTAREALDNSGILLRMRVDEWERRLEGIITPEESRRLRADFNAVVLDMGRLRSEVEVVAKEQRQRGFTEAFDGEPS